MLPVELQWIIACGLAVAPLFLAGWIVREVSGTRGARVSSDHVSLLSESLERSAVAQWRRRHPSSALPACSAHQPASTSRLVLVREFSHSVRRSWSQAAR
jgi:hypothetical protein